MFMALIEQNIIELMVRFGLNNALPVKISFFETSVQESRSVYPGDDPKEI